MSGSLTDVGLAVKRLSLSLSLGLALLVGGCAGRLGEGRPGPRAATAEARAGWTALVNGRDREAKARFGVAIGAPPAVGKAAPPHPAGADLWAWFGEASLAFERADSTRAIDAYLKVLEFAAAGDDRQARAGAHDASEPGDGAVHPLAAMAAARVGILLDEFGGPPSARSAIESRLLALPLARLSWQARHSLALTLDALARRRGDVQLLARAAEAAGCVRTFTVAAPVGILPHLDLEGAAGAPRDGGAAPGARATVSSVGCQLVIPAVAGRPGAQRVSAEFDAPQGGWYDIVVEFRGEARLRVDEGALLRHGSETEYGPRVAATRLHLTSGRHRLELRLASFGGQSDLALLVVPAPAGQRAQAPAGGTADQTPGANADPLHIAVDFAETYVAYRQGHARRAWAGAARLERVPGFALGLAVAAAIARDDPSRPANFTRDRARGLLRAAVALDSELARSRHALAGIALDDDRPREGIEEATAAGSSAPGWWLPPWTLYAGYRLRGLSWDADRALDRALALGPGACPVLEAALARAEDRHDVEQEKRLATRLLVCGRDSDQQLERLRRAGDLPAVEAALRRSIALAPDRSNTRIELASVLLARGKAAQAAEVVASTAEPGDSDAQLRLADALMAAGAREKARTVIARILAERPELPEILRAARAVGLPLPLESFRLDGRQVIREFEASGRRYDAPGVVVLDRTVTRLFASGAEMVLNHEIVRVQSKDAIQKWGEVSIPDRTEILVLRTHKADGSTREPEEFAGKDAISAADLAIGDYIEKETVETRPARDAFALLPAARPPPSSKRETAGSPAGPGPGPGPGQAPGHEVGGPSRGAQGGFLGDRFYFQSFDAPLDRSEYLVVTSGPTAAQMHIDRRAGAPEPARTPLPPPREAASPGGPLVLTTFLARNVPQLFAERSSVPAIEHVPSVRISLGVSWTAWSRFLREQLYGTLRGSPALDRAAAEVRTLSPDATPLARAAALVSWVGQNIEADEDLRDSASHSITRGRGNRLAVILALARELGLDARPVLARSRMVAEGEAPAPLEETDDFAEPLVRFQLGAGQPFYADPRLKHAPLGYLPPGLDGARVLLLDQGSFEVARTRVEDRRGVNVTLRLDRQGGGTAEAEETVRGWPALEWAEIVDRFGNDRTKLRQDFEQRWLGVHFPGAVLRDLQIAILGSQGRQAAPPREPRVHRGSAQGGATAQAARASGTAGGREREREAAQDGEGEGDGHGDVNGAVATAPAAPYAAAEVRLRYSFSSPRLAVKRDGEMRFLPSFFRSQPGRRYATEPRRSTAMLTGFDVPLELEARVELPPGARLLDAPRTGDAAAITGQAGYRFLEERRLDERPASAGNPVLMLRRQSRLPIMRVSLQDYPSLAAELRRVDALEQEEVRIGTTPERP